jgi:hypothetical protein
MAVIVIEHDVALIIGMHLARALASAGYRILTSRPPGQAVPI